jgi:hypothetical protein
MGIAALGREGAQDIVPASNGSSPSVTTRRPGRPATTVVAWIGFAGCVLVVAVLYWAQAVLVPIALAALLAFLLAPVARRSRVIGRIAAVLSVVAIATAVIDSRRGSCRQASSVAELPTYRTNIRHKVADLRWLQHGGTVEKLRDRRHQGADGRAEPAGTTERPIVIARAGPRPVGHAVVDRIGPGAAATGGLVLVLLIFILLEREPADENTHCSAAARSRSRRRRSTRRPRASAATSCACRA